MEKEIKNLAEKRHTLAHLLGASVLKLYPKAKLSIGPAIDNGFYYDIDSSETIGNNDLEKIEKTMRELLPSWTHFDKKEVEAKEAKEFFKENPYKLELIEELEKKGEKITLYSSGTEDSLFTDLCRGGHSENPQKEIKEGSFKLSHTAGAYWRGDEKNKMLTRIYGLAFEDKTALDEYQQQQEEAKKRDHKKLGKELDLFTFSELVGPGLPLWTPKGTLVRHQLDMFVWELREKYGYQRVTIPHFTKKDLYETSGHWQKFSEELFRISTREGKEFAVKPMNCPHHTQIFDRHPHSYKDMPQRYAETTMVYRDEQSGELGGLTRVLSITQDDSHVFCRHNQVREEFFKIWDIIDTFYQTFGFILRVRLSFHDPKTPEKYLGTKEIWQNAEDALREIAQERKADYFEAPGEAAMYGPKLDFMATDSMGRQHQVATIQLDMNLPERFDLTCINEKGEKERIVMIHCAIMGSIERFSAVLIEHTGGAFPLWLSPTQVSVLPISQEKHGDYAKQVFEKLQTEKVRVTYKEGTDSLGKRIRNAKNEKVPYLVIIGDKELEKNVLTVEGRNDEKIEDITPDDFVKKILEDIKNKK